MKFAAAPQVIDRFIDVAVAIGREAEIKARELELQGEKMVLIPLVAGVLTTAAVRPYVERILEGAREDIATRLSGACATALGYLGLSADMVDMPIEPSLAYLELAEAV